MLAATRRDSTNPGRRDAAKAVVKATRAPPAGTPPEGRRTCSPPRVPIPGLTRPCRVVTIAGRPGGRAVGRPGGQAAKRPGAGRRRRNRGRLRARDARATPAAPPCRYPPPARDPCSSSTSATRTTRPGRCGPGAADAGRHPFRGGHAPLRRFAPGSSFKPTWRADPTGRAGAGRRGPHRLGHAGDRRIPGREFSGQGLWPADARRRPAPAASAPRCTRASRPCARLPDEHRGLAAGDRRRVWREQPAVRADVARLNAMWSRASREPRRPAAVRRLHHRRRLYAPV